MKAIFLFFTLSLFSSCFGDGFDLVAFYNNGSGYYLVNIDSSTSEIQFIKYIPGFPDLSRVTVFDPQNQVYGIISEYGLEIGFFFLDAIEDGVSFVDVAKNDSYEIIAQTYISSRREWIVLLCDFGNDYKTDTASIVMIGIDKLNFSQGATIKTDDSLPFLSGWDTSLLFDEETNVLYVGFDFGYVSSYDFVTGKEISTIPVQSYPDEMAINDDYLYVGANIIFVESIQISTGKSSLIKSGWCSGSAYVDDLAFDFNNMIAYSVANCELGQSALYSISLETGKTSNVSSPEFTYIIGLQVL